MVSHIECCYAIVHSVSFSITVTLLPFLSEGEVTIPELVDIVVGGVAEMNESNTGEWVWCVGGWRPWYIYTVTLCKQISSSTYRLYLVMEQHISHTPWVLLYCPAT